jgi:hypothetical protein
MAGPRTRAEKPPNGSVAHCARWRSKSSPLRVTGSLANAARLRTLAASRPSRMPAKAVEDRCACATWAGSAASSCSSRSAAGRVSSVS